MPPALLPSPCRVRLDRSCYEHCGVRLRRGPPSIASVVAISTFGHDRGQTAPTPNVRGLIRSRIPRRHPLRVKAKRTIRSASRRGRSRTHISGSRIPVPCPVRLRARWGILAQDRLRPCLARDDAAEHLDPLRLFWINSREHRRDCYALDHLERFAWNSYWLSNSLSDALAKSGHASSLMMTGGRSVRVMVRRLFSLSAMVVCLKCWPHG